MEVFHKPRRADGRNDTPPAAFNVKKLVRTSACEPKLRIGRIYELRRCHANGKHMAREEKV